MNIRYWLSTPGHAERVADALEAGAKIDRVLCGQLATSEAYAKKNMNRTHEELFAEAEKNVKFLHNIGVKKVFANIGTIFGCPIKGEVPIESIRIRGQGF